MTGFAADRGVATVALVVENYDEAIRAELARYGKAGAAQKAAAAGF